MRWKEDEDLKFQICPFIEAQISTSQMIQWTSIVVIFVVPAMPTILILSTSIRSVGVIVD